MSDVTLERAGPERRETIANLFQFYVHDFAEFWDTRRVDLQEDGRFPFYPPLARYWTDPAAEPLLIRVQGHVAGFALIDREGHSGRLCDFNMGEFFVARPYRRKGVGRRAALAAIRQRPGLWEVAVARNNTPAQAFWRTIVPAAATGPVEEAEQDDARWRGPVLRFRAG